MWKIIIYISILLFDLLINANGCDCKGNLLTQLNDVVNKINNIIRQINQQRYPHLHVDQYCLTTPDNHDYELTMKRALIALNAARNIKDQQINSEDFNMPFKDMNNDLNDLNKERSFYRQMQPSRRSNQHAWNNDFYAALTKALKTEIRQRPELMNDLKDDIESLNIINPDSEA